MHNSKLLRFLLIILIIALFVTLIYFAFIDSIPGLLDAINSGSEAEIENFLRQNDSVKGLLCTALLQIIQVASIVFPSAAIQISAGIVYGTWRAFLVCHLSAVATHSVVFFAARKLKHVLDRYSDSHSKKRSKIDFLLSSDHPTYMTVVAFIVPVLPNGVIPYVAARTAISFKSFVLAAFFGSSLTTFVMCAAGNYFIEGDLQISLVLIGILSVIALVLWIFRNRILSIIKKLTAKYVQK